MRQQPTCAMADIMGFVEEGERFRRDNRVRL